MPRLTVKTSTVFVAVGGKTRIYRSIEDVPPPLRKKLEESTNGINSATILIADRRGREEIVRAIRGLPSRMRARATPNPVPGRPAPAWRSRLLFLRGNWVEILLPGAIGLIVWLLFSMK